MSAGSYTHLDVYKRQASILLGMMILPTIIGVTESAIRSVPAHYYEGALALGAVSYTHLDVYKRQRQVSSGFWEV